MVIYYVIFFLVCMLALYIAGNLVINSLKRIAKFLEWKEFVVAFFIMALAGSLPNLFLGLVSVFNRVPVLSFGDVVGGNVIDLTLAVALAALFAKKGIPSDGNIIQTSSIFTVGAAILPLLLFMDGTLSRGDGVVLVGYFLAYIFWLFSKKERFKKTYNHYEVPKNQRFKTYILDLCRVIAGVVILVAVSQGVVYSAEKFAFEFNVPLALVGILAVSMGTSFPELYFSIVSARNNNTKMILGDLLGSIIIPSTLVLGIVVMLSPIAVTDLAMFALARYFLVVAAFFFFIFVRTDKFISKKEAAMLLLVYVIFLISEVFVK